MNLFQQGLFTLHSGEESPFKIECDALTEADWLTLAGMIAARCEFGNVFGIPRGGAKLEQALRPYIVMTSPRRLVVDDVWTTGESMKSHLCSDDIGYVVFARKPVDDYRVGALFTLDSR